MEGLIERILSRKYAFLGTFFLVFTVTYIILMALDFLPEPPAQSEVTQEEKVETSENKLGDVFVSDEPEQEVMVTDARVDDEVEPSAVVDQMTRQPIQINEDDVFPLSIHIERLDKTVKVLNPTSRTVADLDAALLNGVVRHPDSATLAQNGNIFILGHSSYLPNVFNKNFQAFNGIQDLEWGDTIEVYSADMVYEYRVEKVYKAKAKDVTVPIADTGKMLTLATCNSFGSVDDRYIVEAKQVGEESL